MEQKRLCCSADSPEMHKAGRSGRRLSSTGKALSALPTRLTSRGLALGGRPPTAQGLKASRLARARSWRGTATCKLHDHHERAWGRAGGCAEWQSSTAKDPPQALLCPAHSQPSWPFTPTKMRAPWGFACRRAPELLTIGLAAPRRLTTFRWLPMWIRIWSSDIRARYRWLWRLWKQHGGFA